MENRDKNLVEIVLQAFLPFWPVLLVLAISGLILAKGYLAFSTPKYESNASIVVNDEKKGVDESQLKESFNIFESKKIVENEIEVLHSRDIIEDVVATLNLQISVFKLNFFGEIPLYKEAPVSIVLQDPSNTGELKEKEPIKFTFNREGGFIVIDSSQYKLDTWVPNPYGGSPLMFKANATAELEPEESYYFKIEKIRDVVGGISTNLFIGAASKMATVINISYKDPVPERGNAIVDQLIKSYLDAAIESQDTLAANTLNFIDDRILEVGKELGIVEKKLEKYRASEGVINLGEQGNLYLKNVGDYDRRIAEINLQLSVLDKVEKYVISKSKNAGIVPSTLGVNDPILGQLLQKLYDSEIEYEELSKTTAENNPILITVRNKIDKIRPSILENVLSQKSNLLASKESLTDNSGKYNKALDVLPKQERIFLEITRKKESVSELYNFLSKKREETALSYAPTIGNARIIEKAQASNSPVSPKRSLVYIIGLILPLGLGVVWIAFKELFSSKVLFRSDIADNTKIPIVGELVQLKNNKNGILVSQHQDLFIIDQFRRILSNLKLYDTAEVGKTVLITSSIAGEGKSYVSANLAATLALSGIKTALVDMDLRKANISEIFNQSSARGMSQWLSKDTALVDVTGIEVQPLLTLFPAGEKTTNSTSLLVGDVWKRFLQELRANYDVVIIDSPPTSMVTDANLIAPLVDKVVLVARHAHTPKFLIPLLNDIIKREGFENTEIIFNGLKSRGVLKEDYGYGYGYELATLKK